MRRHVDEAQLEAALLDLRGRHDRRDRVRSQPRDELDRQSPRPTPDVNHTLTGLAIVILMFRNRQTVDVDEMSLMKW